MCPNQSYLSETTDSEISSSDMTKNDPTETIVERQIKTTHKKGNCCNKIFKYPQIKKESDLCSCSQYEKLRASKKLVHHSESQLESSFNSRRCPTAHGKGQLYCCTKEFHRVASDSDCRTSIYKSEIPRRYKEQNYSQDRARNLRNFISCQDTLKALRSCKNEESKQEIGIKAKQVIETNFFNGLKKMNKKKDNQNCGNSRRATQGPPQEKRRKRDNEIVNNCDNDAIYILSSLDGRRDVKSSNASIATDNISLDKFDSMNGKN
ncbi:PREDICTED: uncharacterized protein LOC105361184 [Ceratosolen solmsi marchali]|uniref:Uncharacterized protein LOC105361184 n=1 Tax=Ceratosolen solmsi marchali TaxID=326594 RepID=A0AAJ6YEI3_9HYME|nr:PREDICTED: uncharacterized protein LOC105361184 [Ceratosolen solmsi marchali]